MTSEEIKKETEELLNKFPEELRSTLSYMAYERGHSGGEGEVLNELRSLVGDLAEPLDKYAKRLTAEQKS